MGLPVPREPIELKEFIQIIRSRMSSEDNRSDINYDSLAVWSFNKLPKYLWEEWKVDLKRRSITWQTFLRILKLHTIDMIEWAIRNSLTWEKLIRRVENSINNYSTRRGER